MKLHGKVLNIIHGKVLYITILLCLLPVIPAMADPVTASVGTAAQNFTAASDYGPGTVNSSFADAVKLETALLKSNDPVPLYANQSLGLGGAKIIMIRGTQNAQQLCIVIETADGRRIVVDGGSADNTEYLYRYLCENGGYVDAWLITHPHHDHGGALADILSDPTGHPLDIRKIYCNTGVFGFLQANESSHRLPFLNTFAAALAGFDQSRLVSSMQAGYTFMVGSAEVRVINTPAQYTNDTGNNSSVAYRITLGDKRLMILGDLGYEASVQMTKEHAAEELKADILQLAHHGQHAGCPELYRIIAPTTALWASSEYIWNQVNYPVSDPEKSYTPQVTMSWMRQMGVNRNYSMSYGNWLLQ